MISVEAHQRCIQRLEAQNNKLRLTVRQQDGEIARLQVRGQQLRDAQRARVVAAAVRGLQVRCEALEMDLAQAQQRVAAFQHETFTLRSLVKLASHPELADAARAEADRLVTKEELRTERRATAALRQQCEAFRARAVEACAAAEAAAARVSELEEDSWRSPANANATPSVSTAAADAVARAATAADSERQPPRVAELESALAEERARCAALEETVEAVRSERAVQRSENSTPGLAPSKSSVRSMRVLSARLAMPEAAHASPLDWPGEQVNAASSSGAASTPSAVKGTKVQVQRQRLRRLQRVLRAENELLTGRVTTLAAQNRDLIASRVVLEAELLSLRYGTRASEAAAAGGSVAAH